MIAGPVLVLLVASWWYLTSGRYVSTDDAYVQAARTMISADVSGRVVAVAVHDNERVSRGQILFRLDDKTFRIAVEEAKASLAAARLQVKAMQATYNQKLADMKAAEETLAYQQREYDRQRQLLATGNAPRSTFDQVQNAMQVAHQKVMSAQSDLANMLAAARRRSEPAGRRAPDGAEGAGGARQGRVRPRAHGHPGAAERHRDQGRTAAGRLRMSTRRPRSSR